MEAAHEGEHGVVGAAGGLQAEQRGGQSACGAAGGWVALLPARLQAPDATQAQTRGQGTAGRLDLSCCLSQHADWFPLQPSGTANCYIYPFEQIHLSSPKNCLTS